ncbi:MAG: hypothetical protein ACP5M4_08440 [Acidobacteriaceae bacterium]
MAHLRLSICTALLAAVTALPVIAQSHPEYPNYPRETPAEFCTFQGTV